MNAIEPISRPQDSSRQAPHEPSRFVREPIHARSEGFADAGARPGDVIALPGGSAVVDVNHNGLVDGYDAVARPRVPGPALRVDVRA